MVYSNAHMLITFGGRGWYDQESWQFGLRVAGSVPPSTAQLAALETAGKAFMTSPMNVTSNVKMEFVKVANIGVDGLYPPDLDAQVRNFVTAQPGSSGVTQGVYPQCTLALSLRTARNRGPAHAGRFYSPCTTISPNAAGHIGETQATNAATAAKNLIDAVNNVDLGRVTVFSRVGEGHQEEVTHVFCGDVVDTQRRRRAQLKEEYFGVALAP